MSETLTLPDGMSVRLGERTVRGSKNQTRLGLLSDGREVVVKRQATHGRLANEARALEWLGTRAVPVPELINFGTLDDGGLVLVIGRVPGRSTDEPDGWRRMGRAFASLAAVSVDDCPLQRRSPGAFADDHRARLAEVAGLLSPAMTQEITRAVDHVGGSSILCLTHGDPGSGNYLDHPDGGTILDWETATVSPYGIDAGRGAFIALLDNTGTGIPARLHAAFVDGYRSDPSRTLDDETLQATTLIAALQFIHGRHTRPLRADRTAQQAIDAAARYLDLAG